MQKISRRAQIKAPTTTAVKYQTKKLFMKKLLSTITLILFTFLGAHAALDSGTVDKKIQWSVDTETGILLLTSTGNQNSVTGNSTPWKQYSDYISIIVLGDGITKIGPDVLNDLPNVAIIIFDNNKGACDMPTLNSDNLTDTNLENTIIVVPNNTTDGEIQTLIEQLNNRTTTDNIYKGNYDEIAIGKCGDNLSYIYYKIEKNLTIIGSGAMYDYTPGTAPWYDNRTDIQTVEVGSEATTIGNYAFDGCTALATVTLSSNVAIGTRAIPSSAATHLILNDKQPLLMNNNTFSSVSYVRNYNNTNWQALYLPYEINYDDWSENFDIARINNVHQYDDDSDGTPDRTTIEIFYLKSGSLSANTPYFIRAKATGEGTITVSDATLTPVDAQNEWCASATDIYTFVGTYRGVSGEQMKENNYYGMSAGSLIPVTDPGNSLAAMRWYLKIESKSSASQAARPTEVRIREIGGTTDIPAIEPTPEADGIYHDLSGRPVEHPTQGIYILNGKKVFVK